MNCVLTTPSCRILSGCPIAAYASHNNPTFYPGAGSVIFRPSNTSTYEGDLALLVRGALPLRGYLHWSPCGASVFHLDPRGPGTLLCGKPNLYIPEASHRGTLKTDESEQPVPIESIFVVDHFISMALETCFNDNWKFSSKEDNRWLHDERIGLHNRNRSPVEIIQRGCALMVGIVVTSPRTPQ